MTKKPKFILYNQYGLLLPIAQRLEAEGFECFSYYAAGCHTEGYVGKDGGKGMINIIDDFYDSIIDLKEEKDNVVIIIDDNGRGDEMDNLRNEGWHVVGSSSMTDQYEYNRDDGDSLAKKIGLNISPAVTFSDFGKAQAFLKKQLSKNKELKLVFKGDGADMAGGSYTYLANNIPEMIKFLDWVGRKQAAGGCKVEKFKFQRIVDGLEADFSCWSNGDKFAPEMAVDFEQKKIHGLGKAEGCLGNIVTFLDPTQQPYFKNHLAKLLPEIKGGVATEWAINNIVEESTHKPFFLEFTPRHGWDSTQGELALLEDAGKLIGEFYYRLAFKLPFPKGFFPYNRYSCTVRFYTGGIGEEPEKVAGKPIFWDKKFEKNLWWYSIKKRDDGEHEITGNPVGCAVFCGNTPDEAMKKCYAFLDPKKDYLMLPDIFYSENIGEGVSDEIKQLKEWKIIK